MTALYGDFLAHASKQISAITLPPADLPADTRHAIIQALSRLVTTMARYATDPALPDAFDPDAPQPSNPHAVTALECKQALTHLVLRSAQVRWPIAATSTCWRRDALATAILGHTSELILRALADRAQQLPPVADLVPGLSQAADTIRQAWESWQSIACTWDILTTGRSRGLSPVAAEIGDLVL